MSDSEVVMKNSRDRKKSIVVKHKAESEDLKKKKYKSKDKESNDEVFKDKKKKSKNDNQKVDVYDGDKNKSGMRHGVGKLTFADGSIYEGLWENGKKEGYGTLNYVTGEKYQGEWKNDTQCGDGNLLYPNNAFFHGTWDNGNRKNGEYKFFDSENNEVIFKENWSDDAPGKSGKIECKEGSYVGEVDYIVEGSHIKKLYKIVRSGYGEMLYKKGKYSGYWANDMRKGYGIYLENKGNKYYGNWKKNRKSGFGVYLYVDGTFYEGLFAKDLKNGKGVLYLPNGDLISGEWKDDGILKAKHIKGNYQSIPKPFKSLLTRTIEKPTNVPERSIYTSTKKWWDFVLPISSISNEEVVITIKDIQISMDVNSSDMQVINKKLGLGPIYNVFDNFIKNFIWQYKNISNQSPELLLPHAVDDINSFLYCLGEKLIDILKIEDINRKELFKCLMEAVFPMIYDTLFNLYSSVYVTQNSLMSSKIAEIENVTTEIIGVKDKFQLKKEGEEENGEDPYGLVIESLNKLNESKTPFSKLQCLHEAANSIVKCVDLHMKDKSKQIVMGAEDKFPIFIYCVIKSAVENFYSHQAFLSDFVTETMEDMEADYRMSELQNAILYICTLDWRIRDNNNILTPFKAIIENMNWLIENGLKMVKGDNKRQIQENILITLSKILNDFGQKKHDEYEGESSNELITTYSEFYKKALDIAGLDITIKDDNFSISFSRKYPLYVYSKLSEVVMGQIGSLK